MTITATGSIGLAMLKLVDHVADSATFQSVCGVTTAEAAMPFIHWPWVDFRSTIRPFAGICQSKENNDIRTFGGAMTVMLPEGAFNLMLAIDDDPNLDERDNFIRADNFFSGVIDDLKQLSGISDNLNITAIEMMQEHAVSDPTTFVEPAAKLEANPKFWLAGYRIRWGAV